MRRPRAATGCLFATIVLAAPGLVLAQASASYKLEEHVFNAGGRPAQGIVASSPSYRITLDAIGGSIAGDALAGASYRVAGGFVSAYLPPGELGGLGILGDQQTLTWSREPASIAYNRYAGGLSTLPAGYGTCAVSLAQGASLVDPSTPASRSGMFYLVTGENRLGEEGTKGHASTGAERGNPSPCP
jgi:hypothetical protein